MTLKSLNNQKNGLVIADAGAIFSLAVIDQLEILNFLFDHIRITIAVWKEITLDKTTDYYPRIAKFFNDKTQPIKGFNHLSFLMDYGEWRMCHLIPSQRLKPLSQSDRRLKPTDR